MNPSDIHNQLAELPGWELDQQALVKEFKFADFAAAFEFMKRVALEAERLNHHPDWSNVYNQVTVRLSTHDAGGVTPLDFQLAAAMEGAAEALQ